MEQAHDSAQPASLHAAVGELLEANINRSPTAYLHNPEEERAQYKHNIDKDMTLLWATPAGDKATGWGGRREGREAALPGLLGRMQGGPPAAEPPPPRICCLHPRDGRRTASPLRRPHSCSPTARDDSPEPLAMFSWFPVHGTSVNNTNQLVNGDNKGLAAQLVERRRADTVAAFCQANVGDTSPNTLGPRCRDTG